VHGAVLPNIQVMNAEPREISVTDDPPADRYEIRLGGERVGFVTYRLQPGVITFLHTEVDPSHEGEGLGSRLVRETLDDVRARSLTVHPVCSFVAEFIERHAEYADLVAA
jgi:predicted GNAT family acetyltransferase